jgi:hypothetical protein
MRVNGSKLSAEAHQRSNLSALCNVKTDITLGTSDDQKAGEAKRSVVKSVAGWLLVVEEKTQSTKRGND